MKARGLFFLTCAAGLLLASCSDDGVEPVAPATGEGEVTTVELVVPSGTKTVTVAYQTADGLKTVNAPISTEVNYSDRYGACAITTGTVELASPVSTFVNIYDEQGNTLAQNVLVKEWVNTTYTDVTYLLQALEGTYVTQDEHQTFYHSSGVAMFDDSWPLSFTEDEDYNDVVIDYDIETKYVDMSIIPEQAWREQLKVVMHLRTMGGDYPHSAGLYLESLDERYVKDIEARLTLGNWNEADAERMGVKMDVQMIDGHPLIRFTNLQWLVSTEAENATYINEKDGKAWYMNPRDPAKLVVNNNDQEYTDPKRITFYNINPGVINTGGDLLTITVIFRGEDRNSMSPEEGQAQIDHFIKATTDINGQNFYLGGHSGQLGDFEVHMKGFEPTPLYTKYDVHSPMGVAKDNSTTYCCADGAFYGFKAPVETRHVYAAKPFTKGYPQFEPFFESKGQSNTDWYLYPDDSTGFVSCWW